VETGPALTTLVSGAIATLVYIWRRDVVALIIAHVVTDLYGIVIAPYVATQPAGVNSDGQPPLSAAFQVVRLVNHPLTLPGRRH
jgi:hypothetical protein